MRNLPPWIFISSSLTERASSQSADQALRRFRRLDGAVDIGGRGERHFSDVVLVGGVEAIDPAAFRAVDQLTADQHVAG
jgi:hypothetical protein